MAARLGLKALAILIGFATHIVLYSAFVIVLWEGLGLPSGSACLAFPVSATLSIALAVFAYKWFTRGASRGRAE